MCLLVVEGGSGSKNAVSAQILGKVRVRDSRVLLLICCSVLPWRATTGNKSFRQCPCI